MPGPREDDENIAGNTRVISFLNNDSGTIRYYLMTFHYAQKKQL